MKRLVILGFLLLLALSAIPGPVVRASSSPVVNVTSVYSLNMYGYAEVNETVTFMNNSTSPVTPPSVAIGIGNLSTDALNSTISGSGFSMAPGPAGGPYNVSSIQPVSANKSSSFTLSVLLTGVVSFVGNSSIRVLTLSTPSISLTVNTLNETVHLPGTSSFTSAPAGLDPTITGSHSYTKVVSDALPASAVTSVGTMTAADSQGFNPVKVFDASRTISVSSGGTPIVTDELSLENQGLVGLTTLYVSALTKSGTVTVVPPGETRLISPEAVTLSDGGIGLSSLSTGSIAAGANYTIAYQYPLAKSYYSVSGGQVTLSLPNAPPIPTFVESYRISLSVQPGVRVVETQSHPLANVSPWQTGSTTVIYSLTVGWAIGAGIPAMLIVFALLFAVLFVSRSSMSAEEEEEEETSTEVASAMIKAFDDKTSLINGLWPEITERDQDQMTKAYFDELRTRLDDFRGKALRRLGELKQKSVTQRFSDLLTQVNDTEREVERAAKDKLNLYEQYYTRRMRKEVFDRLLPQYTKRLEKALNDLSDELHVIQKESKLL